MLAAVKQCLGRHQICLTLISKPDSRLTVFTWRCADDVASTHHFECHPGGGLGGGGGGGGGEGASQGRIISWHVADVTEHESQLAALQACLM